RRFAVPMRVLIIVLFCIVIVVIVVVDHLHPLSNPMLRVDLVIVVVIILMHLNPSIQICVPVQAASHHSSPVSSVRSLATVDSIHPSIHPCFPCNHRQCDG